VELEVPITYGLTEADDSPRVSKYFRSYGEALSRLFPYTPLKPNGGCEVSPNSPSTETEYGCPECYAAEKAWFLAHPRPF
jgi:hypothetical protein